MSVNASFFNTYFVAERPLCRVGVFSCKKRGNLNPFRGLSKKNAFFLIFFKNFLEKVCEVKQICVTLQCNNKQKHQKLNTMKTYKITEQRDGAIAATTIKSSMTLKEAQIELLKMAIWDTQKGFTNWGLMVAYANKTRSPFHASPTANDGTRCYTFGVYKYEIAEE